MLTFDFLPSKFCCSGKDGIEGKFGRSLNMSRNVKCQSDLWSHQWDVRASDVTTAFEICCWAFSILCTFECEDQEVNRSCKLSCTDRSYESPVNNGVLSSTADMWRSLSLQCVYLHCAIITCRHETVPVPAVCLSAVCSHHLQTWHGPCNSPPTWYSIVPDF